MFYYLIFNSSYTNYEEIDKKMMITILYGTISYIVTHAIINNSNISFINSLINYFWVILCLDITMFYYVSQNDKLFSDYLSIKQLKDTINSVIDNESNKNDNSAELNENDSDNNNLDINPKLTSDDKNDENNDENNNENNDINNNDNNGNNKENNLTNIESSYNNIISNESKNDFDDINKRLNNLENPINSDNSNNSDNSDNSSNKINNKSTNLNDLIKKREIDMNSNTKLTNLPSSNNDNLKNNRLSKNFGKIIKTNTNNKESDNGGNNFFNLDLDTNLIDSDSASDSASESGSEFNFDINEFESSL